ncbi:unnamed protein product [Closterium sp. NIES-53]
MVSGAGGGGGGDVASGGSGSAGAGGAPRAATGDSPTAAGGGDARVRQPPTGLLAAEGGAGACLGASLAARPVASVGTCVDTSPRASPEDASLSFILESGASHCFFRDRTTLTPLPTPVSVALADPTVGPVTARYTTTLPCLAVPSGSLTSFHVPLFSRNLVGVRPLVSQHVGVWIQPFGETAVFVDGDTYEAGIYTLHTGPRGQQQQHWQQQQQQQLLPPTPVTVPRQAPTSHQVAMSPQVAVSGQVPVSSPLAASCSCQSLAHPTVLWQHRMGHPSISRLRAMSSQRLVLGLPHVLPSLPPSLAPPCGPYGPASCPSPERESFFLVVVDDYSRYTTLFPLAKKSDVTSTLIWWLLTTADTRGCRVSCLHSDCGGEFCSGILAGFCSEQGICQSWMLLESPQQNGVAERRIGLVTEIARTSMTHARAPHFLWPYAVRYATHHMNPWPRVSRPEFSPTSLWTGSPGAASRFRVWGCLALVRDTFADKISPRAEDSSDYTFHHPPLRRFFDSRDVRFDESVPYYVRYPCRGLPVPPAPLFLTSAPPPAHPVQPPPPAGFRGEDPGGASSRGAGVGAESVPVRGPMELSLGVLRLGVRPLLDLESLGRTLLLLVVLAVGVVRLVLWSGPRATTAPDTTPPPHPYPTRHQARVRRAREEQLQLEREERELEQQQQELQRLEEQQQQQQQQPPPPPVSGLRTLGLPSPSPPSPPSPPVSSPPLPPPDPSPAVFPPPLPPLSPPLSHTWPLRRSPRARPSSPVPFTDLRTALFCSCPPRLSPSVLPSPPESALTASLSTLVIDYYCTYRLVLSRVLASLVTDPRASLSSVSALTAAFTEFASTRYLDYATSLVAAPPTSPLVIEGESALGCDALEDNQFELEFLAAASPYLCAMLLALEGDLDALDIPTPRTYAVAVSGPWVSQWRAAMDSKMASYRSTGTYVDEVPPLGANVVDGMWIFRVKWPLGSPSVFKVRYVARGFSQCKGVDFFQTFAPTPKMTTLRVLPHVAAQRDYELHSLDFSTAFLQGHLHEEVWLCCPSAFTGTFPPGTQWRLRRPVYGLRQAPREWHNTLYSTISNLGFQPSSVDPTLVALADVKLELQKRHTCTDLGELRHYLGLQITRDRAARTITLSQSHMMQQVLQRFELQHSTIQRTPLAIDHRLTRPFPDEPFELSGPYAELVGCLMYLMTCTRPDLAFLLGILARFVAPGRHRPVHWTFAVRVAKYLATTSGVGLVLGGRQDVVLTGHCDFSYADDAETHKSTHGYCFSLSSGAVSWRSTRSSSVLTSTAEAEIYAGAMAAQELRWGREQARFDFVESEANIADIFSKAMPPCDHQRCCVQLGLVDTALFLCDWSCDRTLLVLHDTPHLDYGDGFLQSGFKR